MTYLYDGTFDGFLTCVYEHYYSGKADAIFPSGAYQAGMFAKPHDVRTEDGKARKVEDAITEKISPHALARVYRVFRTSVEDKEMLLLNYIRFCFRHGPSAACLHTHPLVLPVDKAEHRIANEAHRLCGLIRFSVMTATDSDEDAYSWEATVSGRAIARRSAPEILYARISPDHDVLEFIAPHFADRFKSEPFIIHDTERGKAAIAWRRRWRIEDFTDKDATLLTGTLGEQAYRDLWCEYFNTMAIKERTNSRCQRGLMPARYWKNLPEMNIR
ncbi:MAG: TIGR03915 family putative DNA repair protein [Clostridiales Family XIII bacterium]|jgi:probable DNA metabolism protein|nr:TIGR03915 family putative DNA repair protein [Clostridiales Family XIII bacterium]